MNELITLISWWLATTLLGAIAFPTAFFTFRHLRDRGYAAARVLGLLLASYVAWMAAHQLTGLLPIVIGIAALAALSAYLGRGLWKQQWQFLREQSGYIVVAESVFLALLLFGVWYETTTGAIFQTEKAADFSVLLGVMTTPHMPPRDPWLSGAYVSYYYFGYFMLAVIAKLTGTVPAVAHNMGLALTMAFTGLVAFGLGYALTGRRRFGLLLVFAMTMMGNLDYWFRAPHAYQFGDLQARYLANHPAEAGIHGGVGGMFEYLLNMMLGSSPQNHNWEYFQASRIIDLTPGEHLISEFPAFSFVLADVHPHLLSLPFFMLAIGLALSIAKAPLPGWRAFGTRRGWQVAQWIVAGLLYGSLGFINSWDLPTVLTVFGVALLLRELWAGRGNMLAALGRAIAVGVPIVAVAVAAYVPFYLTLRTQARGIGILGRVIDTASGPVAGRTDIYYWLVIIGPFLLVLVPALVWRARVGSGRSSGTPPTSPSTSTAPSTEAPKAVRARKKREVARKATADRPLVRPSRACSVCGAAAAADVAVCAQCGGDVVGPDLRADVPDGRVRRALITAGRWLSGSVSPWGKVLAVAAGVLAIVDALYPLLNPSVTIFSLVFLVLAVASIAARNESRELSFAAALVAVGFLLIAGCEWFYVRDLFSMFPHLYRMNTVFKLYMQAWVLLSAGSVALLAWFWEAAWPRWSPTARRIWLGLAIFVGIGVCIFPVAAYHNRVSLYGASISQLDGSEFLSIVSPDEARAVDWLRANVPTTSDPKPVMLQAWGGSFTLAGAAATFSGLSTVLAWEGHEEQWRGGKERPVWHGIDADDTVLRRYGDVDALYQSPDLDLTRRLIDRYGIQYVYVGPIERQKYGSADFGKWEKVGHVVYNQGAVVIYDVRH
jgi:uncharacterized membrane protein